LTITRNASLLRAELVEALEILDDKLPKIEKGGIKILLESRESYFSGKIGKFLTSTIFA